MKISRHPLLATALIIASLSTTSALACTNITLKAKDGTITVGRTLEFGPPLNSNIMTTNRGQQFSNTAPNGKASHSWSGKYGYIYFSYFGQSKPFDGVNEKGLSIGGLYMPGYTTYSPVPANPSNAMPYFQFPAWVLSNFDTVASFKQSVQSITVFNQNMKIAGQGDVSFPLHFIITDKTGKSVTVEWLKGKMMVSDNPLGILTNSPSFSWQLNNLKNFANLSPYSPNPLKISGIDYSGLGQGAGSVGLPGDPTPPSRFVKMAFLTQTAVTADNANDNLVLAQHIINNVDLPKGLVRGTKDDPTAPMDTTQWTVFKDLTHGKIYFKSYNYPSLRMIDLNKIDFSAKAPQLSMPIAAPAPQYIDVTPSFVKPTT